MDRVRPRGIRTEPNGAAVPAQSSLAASGDGQSPLFLCCHALTLSDRDRMRTI
jgi:hypothetical protein